jgi:A/G-specific adenine glycosylase
MTKASLDGISMQSLADNPDAKTIGAFQRRLTRWYRTGRRDLPWRRTANPYHIWVSEVMLQQTQVATVIDYFNRFIRQFPDIPSLAAAEADRVLKAWEGLGYYSRARHLQQAAQQLTAGGNPRVPEEPETFLQLPGVGDYINAAVQSIAFGHALAVVDGNVKRVLSRLFLKDEPVNRPSAYKTFRALAAQLLDLKAPGDWNQAMMELGALICKPRRPLCDCCPAGAACGAFARQRVPEFPVRAAAKKIPHRHLIAGVVIKKGKLLIVRRPADGLLGGMWEFPAGPVKSGQSADTACREAVSRSVGLTVTMGNTLGRVRHAYTHFTLDLDACLCRPLPGRVRLNGPDAFAWVSPGELSSYPLHKAVHKLLPKVRAFLSYPAD